MKVLILGANGMLGPWVVPALEARHELLLTDIVLPKAKPAHEFRRVDVGVLDEVVDASDGVDCILNLSVLRWDRKLAFDVSARGNYNLAEAAVRHGIRRIINTGPHYQLAGPTYEDFDFGLHPDMPPQPGTRLYALTKALGQEILRVYSERYDLYVQTLLFCNFYDPTTLARPEGGFGAPGGDLWPFSVAWQDAGEAVRLAIEIELARLPSRCETYDIFTDLPHGRYVNSKARRQLGWQTRHFLESIWTRRQELV
ncbi:MAG: NAD(P)-dependent oxidoreductase [Chloroflexi bacterium]|nr:NAD(P)-dependent oxidoreductase [Chloroflexota bacterium]